MYLIAFSFGAPLFDSLYNIEKETCLLSLTGTEMGNIYKRDDDDDGDIVTKDFPNFSFIGYK